MEIQSRGFSKLFIHCFSMRVIFSEMYFYSCLCFSLLKNSFFRPSLLVPASVDQIQNITVEEGRNVTKECNVTAGTHPLNVFWENLKTGQVTEEKLLNIINIRRNQGGEYRCTANDTCGNESTTMFINVQCKIILVASFDKRLY